MNLRARIQRLEQSACITAPLKLTVELCDRLCDGTISDEEFQQYVPLLRETGLFAGLNDPDL